MHKLFLASASPRRKELLKSLGVEFDIVVSDIDEKFDTKLAPELVVQDLATKKALVGLEMLSDDSAFTLGADTVCVLNDEIIGKARDAKHAKEILQKTRGNMQKMLTGVSLAHKGRSLETFYVSTEIYLKYLSDREIEEYIETGEYKGVAGAYNYQGSAKLFTEYISGSETNIIGLPLDEVKELLNKHLPELFLN